MKKAILSFMVLAVITAIGISINLNADSHKNLSALALANIEALASSESGGSGT